MPACIICRCLELDFQIEWRLQIDGSSVFWWEQSRFFSTDLIGVFGNNWLFYIPTSGSDAGEIVPFAYGPPRCELTGPTFVGDTLIIAVQHPGENVPYNPQQALNRDIEMLNLDGSLFTQNRTVPRGSNWPSNVQGNPSGPPKPSVIGIRRKESKGSFV